MESLKPVIDKLENLFSKFNEHFYGGELQTPIITVSPDTTKGAYGWCTSWKAWKQAGSEDKDAGYYEINICAEHLTRKFEELCGTLLHEMVHLWNLQNGVQDTSRGGTYHNKKFKEVAEQHGLIIEQHPKYGWTLTKLNEETKQFINSLGDTGFGIYRDSAAKIKTKKKHLHRVHANMFVLVVVLSSGQPKKYVFSVWIVKHRWKKGNKSPTFHQKGYGKVMKYAIFEGNIDRLEKKLKRISNKCKVYGCDFRYEQTGEEFRELKDEKGNKYTARFVLVEAEGTAVINDWEFVAELEHTEKGNIITGVAGIEVPERYYTTTPVCEHCNSKRYRKNTYIVRNKTTGEFKQVGKSCLKDFTHGMSAEAVTQYMSLFDTLIEGETPEPGCSYQRYVNTKEYLSYVAETIRHFGYTRSSDEGISTAIRALDFYDAAHGRAVTKEYLQDLLDKMWSVNFDIDSDLTVKLVSDALAWVSEQEENSNYIHNLKTACSLEYVKGNFGLYASLFPAYNRDLERTAKRKAVLDIEQSSEYVGEISNRITVKVQSVKCVTSWETDFGVTHIYKIIGADGNVYTWKTGKFIDDTVDEMSITGTVKAHTEFRGVKQTELTRCRVAA